MILAVEVHLTNSVFNLSNWFQLPFLKTKNKNNPLKPKQNKKKHKPQKSQELKSQFWVKVECLRI